MAKKISALTQITTIDRAQDKMVIVDVSDTTEAPSGTTKNMTPNQLTTPEEKTGTAVVFTSDAVYGTIDAPEDGNITASYTGAVLGVTVLILHEDTSEPTFPAQFNLMSGTYDTTAGVVNRIYCVYLDDNNVDYSISQPQ